VPLPLWRKLHAIADSARDRFTALWQHFFLDARLRVSREDLTDVLDRPNVLEAQMRVTQLWEQAVERPARRTLPDLGMGVVEDMGQAATIALAPRLTGDTVYTTGLAETEQWVQTYIGRQITAITDTTLTTIRRTLQEGWRAGTPPKALARELRDVIGLTPRQATAIARQEAKLVAQGQAPSQVRRAGEQLRRQAIRQRAEVISRSESLAMGNYGAHSALDQSVRRGYVDESRIRRHWLATTDSKCCEDCLAIDGMNPDGVGLHEEFQTPFGPLLLPPGHPNCRCAVSIGLAE
jgi:hypothetical protein